MSEFSGLTETNLDVDRPTSSWSMLYTLQSATGEYLHLCLPELTRNAKLARMITARQADAIRKKHPELQDLKLRKGLGLR